MDAPTPAEARRRAGEHRPRWFVSTRSRNRSAKVRTRRWRFRTFPSSFTICPNAGELIAIVGPSGCGKSTVLRIIAGLRPHFPPTSGEAHVFGKPIEKPDADRGVVDQKYSLMPHLTVADNIAFGLKLRGVGAQGAARPGA